MQNKRYREALAGLNARQRKAVNSLDGPVLVVAGPGTGKTQLISTRVGHILEKTDTPPDGILLLTFTEAGVEAMRERLNSLVGKAAYDVQLSTYHAFGGEIFRRYPDFFEGAQLRLIEELGSDALLRDIIARLPYSNPLKFADSYINDLKNFISESKRALLTPNDIDVIAAQNLKFIKEANRTSHPTLNKITTVSKSSVPLFEELLADFGSYVSPALPNKTLPLARYAHDGLVAALEQFQLTAKTTELTQWKRNWLARDERGRFIIDGQRTNQRLAAAGKIYRSYQHGLDKGRLYDYDDMILRAIGTLESNPDLKYSLAERYSYIMLDEFQDTNLAQFRLVQLLSDHPVHEGRPNVLAVGDDDQAIYAFQGAHHANMANFINHYKDVKIISLEDNYRSWPDLLEVDKNVIAQVQSRLVNQLPYIKKDLRSVNKDLPEPPRIEAREFKSDAAQHSWIASQVRKIIGQGIPAGEITILAPKHRYLIPLLPYLAERKIPVNYERRENVLDDTLVHQLEQMSRLVLALADGDERQSNYLWPEVLSYDFWQVATEKIWQTSWQSRQSGEPWTALLLNDEPLKPVATFFIRLSNLLGVTTLEKQLDALIGVGDVSTELKLPIQSPLYEHYFSKDRSESDALGFNSLISNLNILRSRLRDWRQNYDEPIGLRALVEFIEGYRAANINILNTSPYHDTADAVNLLTAYGAKGREFSAVFIIAASDEVWGSTSRNQGYRLSLPANLSHIRYQGASEDERLRLLYVAATRARTRLYFTSYAQDLAGKNMTRLKYLNIVEEEAEVLAKVLPAKYSRVNIDESENVGLVAAANYWTNRHVPPFRPSLKEVLKPRLDKYQLSATDLNHFIDIVNYGPDGFFIKCLLGFPLAPSVGDSFGTAMHRTLRFAGRILQNEGRLPGFERLFEIFNAQLSRTDLLPGDSVNLSKRGRDSLKAWLKQYGKELRPSDRFEYNFQNENSRLGAARLSGSVDRMAIDEKTRKITVIDYKTGRAYQRWQPGIIKLHMYQNQLLFYKFLIENSARYRKYHVEKGIIEFIEPDEKGNINRLEYNFDEERLQATAKLINRVWDMIMTLRFPDVSAYPLTLAGIRKFEEDLIN